MDENEVIMITGVGGYWGAEVAARLIADAQSIDETDIHVIGLDSETPKREIKGLDFIQADVRNPLLVELLASERVTIVCHLDFTPSVRLDEATFEKNVIGTMKLMAACSEAGVQKIILKSSMAVYGARPDNPGYISEDHPLQGSLSHGLTRDMIEIESFCNGFRRQVPETDLIILRFPSIIGPTADTPLVRFLKEPFAPVLLGFDPQMQVIHERDVVDALVYAIMNDVSGIYNIAAEGNFPLRRLMTLASKIPLPVFHPIAYVKGDFMRSIGAPVDRFVPIEWDYLRYPWVGDLMKMRDEFGYVPRYSAEEALREFAGQQRINRYAPGSEDLAFDEQHLRDIIESRRRKREQAVNKENAQDEN